MKKWMYLLFLFVLFSACTEESVQTSNAAFQTLKNKDFWRADSFKAYLQKDNSLIIEGYFGFEKVTLKTISVEERVYKIEDSEGNAFFANTDPEKIESFSAEKATSAGQIVITDFNNGNKMVSGTFRFEAVNDDDTKTENKNISFTEGVFYKIPIVEE